MLHDWAEPNGRLELYVFCIRCQIFNEPNFKGHRQIFPDEIIFSIPRSLLTLSIRSETFNKLLESPELKETDKAKPDLKSA